MTPRRPLLAASLALSAPARAQAGFPNRPMRMVIPWPPGQATDVQGRIVAQMLSQRLGQSCVPENKPGAGGQIGTAFVAKAAPDGYTMLAASIGPITFSPLVQKTAYDVERDFAALVFYGLSPYLLLIRPGFPASDARGFVAEVKRNPGKYTYASSGIGGAQHLITALFFGRAGIEALHIPFQGSGPAMAAFLGGQVDFAIETVAGAGALVKNGQLKPLGLTTASPSALLAGIPPLAEAADIPGFDIGGWNGLMLPRATPAETLARIERETMAGLSQPDLRGPFAQIGVDLQPQGQEAFVAQLRKEKALFGPVIRQLGIRAE